LRNSLENKERYKRQQQQHNIIPMMAPHEVDRLITTLHDSYINLKSIAANAAASNKKRQKIDAEKLATQFQLLVKWLEQWQSSNKDSQVSQKEQPIRHQIHRCG
jgi:hypothetical protein